MSKKVDRRQYWAETMEQAYHFMMAVQEYPVQECLEPLAYLPDAVKAAGVEVTFSTKPHAAGLPRMFYMRKGLVNDLLSVAEAMNRRGWRLHVEDTFRSRQMQTNQLINPVLNKKVLEKTIWELNGKIPDAEFFFRRMLALIAFTPKVGTHTSASAIDMSAFKRADGSEVDRGAPYLECSELTPMACPLISEEARKNRREIEAMFAEAGFVAYGFEFWHFSKGDVNDAYYSGGKNVGRYGPVDMDPNTLAVSPIPNAKESLVPMDVIREKVAQLLAEMNKN